MSYVQAQGEAGRLNQIVQEPYPPDVYAVAAATTLIPTAFQVFLYFLIRERLPGRSDVIKGAWFGLLLLAIGDNLIRSPVMNLIIGNPIDVMLVQSAEAWTIAIIKGMLIGILSPQLMKSPT
jgi:hypothetical protein